MQDDWAFPRNLMCLRHAVCQQAAPPGEVRMSG